MKLSLFLMIVLALLTNLSFGSDVYKCSDKDGKTYYSTNPCEGGKKEEEVKTREPNPSSEIPETAPESKTNLEHVIEPSNGIGSSHEATGKTLQCSVEEVIDGDTFDCSFSTPYEPEKRTQVEVGGGRCESLEGIDLASLSRNQLDKVKGSNTSCECLKGIALAHLTPSQIDKLISSNGNCECLKGINLAFLNSKQIDRLIDCKGGCPESLKGADLGSLDQSEKDRMANCPPVVGSPRYVIKERVRLIGVDAPESEDNPKAKRDAERSGQSLSFIFAVGQKATEFTKSYLQRGTNVNLELDVQQKDNYGRLLAYVYLPDGTMLNALLLQEGYAQIMTIPPNVKFADMFLRTQQEAREANRGLWALGMR